VVHDVHVAAGNVARPLSSEGEAMNVLDALDIAVSFCATLATAWLATAGLMNVTAWLWAHRGQPSPWIWRGLVWPDIYHRLLDRQ
jgi:hypothetical protein